VNAAAGTTIGCLPVAKYRVSSRRSLRSRQRSLLPRSSPVVGTLLPRSSPVVGTFEQQIVVVSCCSLLGRLDVVKVVFKKISFCSSSWL